MSCRKEVGDEPVQNGKKNEEYRLKASPSFVVQLTPGVGIAKANAVVKTSVKQFWVIPLAGRVVAPIHRWLGHYLFSCQGGNCSFTGERRELEAGAKCTRMQKFHGAGRKHEELWLNA